MIFGDIVLKLTKTVTA